jgi:hypothetical protein
MIQEILRFAQDDNVLYHILIYAMVTTYFSSSETLSTPCPYINVSNKNFLLFCKSFFTFNNYDKICPTL